MTKCTFPGCNVQVTTPGHKLCYEHWKAGRDQPRAAAPAPAPAAQSTAVPKTPLPVVPSKTPAPAEVSKAPQPAPAAAPQPRPPTPPAAPADGQLLSATAIGEKLGFTSQRINQILAELGWINREKKGWVATAQGLALGAVQKEAYQTGIPYVAWPESLTANKALTATIKSAKGEETPIAPVVAPVATPTVVPPTAAADLGFRERFPASERTTDGHWVRSRAESLIDNWLYFAGIVHAYERKLPVEEDAYCDFYIPSGKVYIEFWGLENDERYVARKKVKLELYKKYSFNLIQLTDEHIRNLDDHLPKMLLKFNVTSL